MVARESFLYPGFDIMFPVLIVCVFADKFSIIPVEQGIGPPPVCFTNHVASHSKLSAPLSVHPVGDLVLLKFLFALLGGLLYPVGIDGIKLLPLVFERLLFSRLKLDISFR